LRQNGVETPIGDDQLLCLNPFAVTFRYDDMDIELITREDAGGWALQVRKWAEDQVGTAAEAE
jgi:hypothetical protein